MQRKTASQSKYSPVDVIKKMLQLETEGGVKKYQRTKGKVFYSTLVNSAKSKIVPAKGAEQALTVICFSHYY